MIFTWLLYDKYIGACIYMKLVWNMVNKLDINIRWKRYLFLFCFSLICAASGLVFWLFAGRVIWSDVQWMLCFLGYPMVYIGFYGGYLYLAYHDIWLLYKNTWCQCWNIMYHLACINGISFFWLSKSINVLKNGKIKEPAFFLDIYWIRKISDSFILPFFLHWEVTVKIFF